MSAMDRFKILKEKRCCYQCLFPGADMSRGKHKDGKCQYDFVCKHISHDKFTRKKHFFVCEEHKDTKDNEDLLKLYKSRFITNQRHQDQLPDFAREIRLSHHTSPIKDHSSNNNSESIINENLNVTSIDATFPSNENSRKIDFNDSSRKIDFNDSIKSPAIYMLQRIQVGQNQFNIFYDTGCGDFVSRYSAIQRIGKRATQLHDGPVTLGGVGGVSMQSKYGIYGVQLPID